jgi:hypothetical protein
MEEFSCPTGYSMCGGLAFVAFDFVIELFDFYREVFVL